MPEANPTPDEATAERAISAIEAFADKWIAETETHDAIAALGRCAPGPFKDAMSARIEGLVRQAYIEAFYAGFNYHKDGAALRVSSTPPSAEQGSAHDERIKRAFDEWYAHPARDSFNVAVAANSFYAGYRAALPLPTSEEAGRDV